jgi:selenide,water dikinase
LAQVLRRLHGTEITKHPDLLIGIDGSDDAGVYRISDDLALVQTVDFFTPIVDDPRDWGRIAAANALSDVYAMGGTPLTALQLLSWPRDVLPWDTAADVIDGAVEVLTEANCTLVGGHSIDDSDPKFGFAITGTVHPDRMITNKAARPGDRLVLTKALGTGVISTAIKDGVASPSSGSAAIASMSRLNASAAAAAVAAGIKAGTDVTGFGLLGHLAEMLQASDVSATIDVATVPILPGAIDIATDGHVPGGTKRNFQAVKGAVDFGETPSAVQTILVDAQTSGGLLLAVHEDDLDGLVAAIIEGGDIAAVIGRIDAPVDGGALITIK